MSQYVDGGNKGFPTSTALAEGIAVKISAGTVIASTAATDKTVGITTGVTESGEVANVRLRSAAGTVKVKLGGTVAVGDFLVATTAGKLITGTAAIAGAVPTSEVIAIAIEAGVLNDFIEAIPANTRY